MKFYAYSLVLPIALFTQALAAPKPQTVIHCKFSLTRIVSLTMLSWSGRQFLRRQHPQCELRVVYFFHHDWVSSSSSLLPVGSSQRNIDSLLVLIIFPVRSRSDWLQVLRSHQRNFGRNVSDYTFLPKPSSLTPSQLLCRRRDLSFVIEKYVHVNDWNVSGYMLHNQNPLV